MFMAEIEILTKAQGQKTGERGFFQTTCYRTDAWALPSKGTLQSDKEAQHTFTWS